MKLSELIADLEKFRAEHGDLACVTRDFLSGVMSAVIILPPPRVARLTALNGRQRKLRLSESKDATEQKVVVL